MDRLTYKINDVVPENDKLIRFEKYMRRQWLPLAKILSVYQRPIATNDICENYHRYLGETLGVHPHIWKMLSKWNFTVTELFHV